MNRTEAIRRNIVQVIDKFGLYRACDHHYSLDSERARECAALIFEEVLNNSGYLKPGLTTERERVISAIAPALGEYDTGPEASPPGQWGRTVSTTPPNTEIIADNIYSTLRDRGYITT